MTHKRRRIVLFFGGRSVEHEFSLCAAIDIYHHLDKNKYDVVLVGISQEGKWLVGIEPAALLKIEQQSSYYTKLEEFFSDAADNTAVLNKIVSEKVDVIFPALLGAYGEDGTFQGLFEMIDIPYVGSRVLGSALGMDKEKSKMILQAADLAVVNFLTCRRNEWEQSPDTFINAVERKFKYPCFVKSANSGTSIGVSKVYGRSELEQAIHASAKYDNKIIVEEFIHCREIECAVLGNNKPMISCVGEIITKHDFYDYNAKYDDSTSYVVIPADIPTTLAEEIRRQASKAFRTLDLSGLARIDFFLTKETNQIYINEVNTLPYLGQDAMYAQLCEAAGISYPHLLDMLIELALETHADRQRNKTRMVTPPLKREALQRVSTY